MKNKLIFILFGIVLCMFLVTGIVSAQTGFQEVKIRSQLFNGVIVGKTVIPAGWFLNVEELTLNPESITWPNALYVTISSPDVSVTMNYLSRRDFQQQKVYGLGVESQSADNGYDESNMLHTLNYRNAAGSCDYMVNVLYPGSSHTFLSDKSYSDADAWALYQSWQKYDSSIRNAFSYAGSSVSITDTDMSIAERTYQSGNNKTVVAAAVSGYEVVSQFGSMYTDNINWRMNAVFAMQAPAAVFDQYMDIFSVFALNTIISQEYNTMTDLHSTYLWNYFMALKEGKNPSEKQLEIDLGNAANETISTGDSYSALEGWSDVIQDQNDYTLSSGSHIKLSTSFDHVYEDSDGNIYAGFGSYYPEGTTELFPTGVGSN